ncbi:MAG: PulJ/GspJ family protein [Pirellulales bacterium]
MTLSNTRQPRFSRLGFTLVEMLVAMTLTLVLFFSVAQMFSQLGGIMEDGRALIEMSGELRGVTHTLQQDLDNRTVEVQPWIQPGTNQGYFEIVEGPDRDKDFAGSTITMGGDADDVLAFTAYSKDEPFVGLVQGTLQSVPVGADNEYKYFLDPNSGGFTALTSQYAEIVYWTRCTLNDDRQALTDSAGADAFTDGKRDRDETVTLYRRVLLIRPDIFIGRVTGTVVAGNVTFSRSTSIDYFEMRNYFDLSVRPYEYSPPVSSWLTNSLEDLQLRQNRIGHLHVSSAGGLTPSAGNDLERYPLRPDFLPTFEDLDTEIGAVNNERDRIGEDVVLSKLLAFDVRVFDPDAPIDITTSSTVALQPGDLGYIVPSTVNNTGAYVDLNWANGATGTSFSGEPHLDSLLRVNPVSDYPRTPTVKDLSSTTYNYQTYDTWPFLYEMDGTDSDGDTEIDQGTNGFDDPGGIAVLNIIDDAGELETSPPYPEPLRGIQVQIRVYEDGTRQIRQDTVMGDFIPE